MIKRITFLVIFLLFSVFQITAQFTDDFERYNHERKKNRISPQSNNWITWSEDADGNGYIKDEDGIVINTDKRGYSFSGKQALLIKPSDAGSVPQDVILDLHNKSTGLWELSWQMYIPARKREAYYNFQENTPVNGTGNWAIQVYFNGHGDGTIEDDHGGSIVDFSYPWKEWFQLKHTIDLDNDHITIELITATETTEIYNADFLSSSQHLGGVDFYSISEENKYYIDDVIFSRIAPVQEVYIWKNNRWEDQSGNALSGEPDTSYEVILKEPFVVGTSTAASTLNCLNLVLEDQGSLTVPAQKNVVISGDLGVPSGNEIIIENNGSFVMLNNTANIDMPDPGSFSYTRTSGAMESNDYTYWSSPVENIFVSGLGSLYVYSYDTEKYIDLFSGRGYPQTSGSPDNHDDNGDDWLYEDQNNILISGKGYAALKQGTSNEQTVVFTGKPNNGFISVPVALSGDDSNDEDDWNLIGNPYPSAIDAKVLINSNINLSGTLYFWTHNTELGGGSNTGPGESNYNSDDYASFNLSGGAAASTGGDTPNGYIAAGQGFFMDVKDAGVITFNNDMRVINTTEENAQFFKPAGNKDKPDQRASKINRVWLNFSNDKGVFSQSLVAFLPGATNGYEPNYDGVRAGADLNTKFYSVLGDKELSIQGRPVLEDDANIPLGYYITKPDDFVISIDQMEGRIINDDMMILLKDNELNITHDLKKSDYHFTVEEAGTNNNRFTLQITAAAALGTEKIIKENELIIIHNDHYYKIKASKTVRSVRVYDIMGRLLVQKNPGKQSFDLEAQNIKKGTILIFSFKFTDGSVLSKKMLQLNP